MNDVLALAPLLVCLGPLLAAALIGGRCLVGVGGDAAEAPTARLAEGGAGLSLSMLALTAIAAPTQQHLVLAPWFASGDVVVQLSFTIDALALSFAALILVIGLVTLRFARQYLHREAAFHRFFFGLSLFLGGMLLLTLAGDLVLMFVGWEFCGFASWLLVSYAWRRPEAADGAVHVFVSNRIGDAGFILGIALMLQTTGSTQWPALAAWVADAQHFDQVAARLLLFGLLLAAVVKSAQLPFSAWPGRALEGPTPSSAIFYGALLLHAGVYMVLRLEAVLLSAPDIMVYLALIGAATALYAWLAGMTQADVKSSLLYSTLSQIGLMFLACGLGWFTLAAWHMGLHAAWRAWQFLQAPAWRRWREQPASPPPAWLRRRRWLYAAAVQRFWLEEATQAALVRPLRAIAVDVRDFDDKVLSHLVGMPRSASGGGGDEIIQARGLAGKALQWLAARCVQLEGYLILQPGAGRWRQALHRLGGWLRVSEALLEQPRYLLLAIAVTFIVIL